MRAKKDDFLISAFIVVAMIYFMASAFVVNVVR